MPATAMSATSGARAKSHDLGLDGGVAAGTAGSAVGGVPIENGCPPTTRE
jgi:hypothetical protein